MNVLLFGLRAFGLASLCLAPYAAAQAADRNGIAELKRAIEALRAENQALGERLGTLEAQRVERAPVKSPVAAPSRADDQQTERLEQRVKELELKVTSTLSPVDPTERLEQRVKELEMAKVAQEDAVRSIIRDSVSSLGSKINEAVSLSGTLAVTIGRASDFSGAKHSSISLTSADFEFEIQANEWALGHIKLEYVDGSNILFPTITGKQSGVDRINLDTAYLALGNQQKFPPLLAFGRMVLPFGISTGHPVADVLSVASPLTVDTFEMRQNAIGLSVAFPTPALGPLAPPVTAPPVRPVAVYPLLGAMGRGLGYDPPPKRLQPLAPLTPAPELAPFNAGIYAYDGRTPGGPNKHVGGTVGYQTKGHCGRRYEELTESFLCPWAVNVDLGYNSSIFSSRFLEAEYEAFLAQIGRVPGMSASVKASLGPFSLVGEWNGATRHAAFLDDLGSRVAIKPAAWQASLGYQLGWNPWVREIGAQGTYLAIGYSRSYDLAGVTELINGAPTRVGFAPRKRLLLTAGEWVVDGVRLAVEYSRNWDYAVGEGGTGNTASGISATLTYAY